MTELLSCPFCGSPNIDPEGWMSVSQDGTEKKSGPACDECGGSTESVERWNERWYFPDDKPRATRDAAEGAGPFEKTYARLDRAGKVYHTTAPPKPEPSLDTNSVADSPGEKTGTHGASKEAGGHSRGGLTPVSTLSPKPAPAMRTLVLQLTPEELSVVQEIAEYHQLSELQTMRQALRFYQLHDKRVRDGETVRWSGDAAREREFAALAVPVSPADGAGETEQEFEDRLHKEDARDMLRLLDHIADKIGLPHDQELSRDNFNRWFRALPSGAGAAEPVTWRWKPRGSVTWIYDPHPGWFAEHKDEIDHEPLYATPPVRGDREAIAIEVMNVRRRIHGLDDLDLATLRRIKRDAGINEAFAIADAILSLPVQPVEAIAAAKQIWKRWHAFYFRGTGNSISIADETAFYEIALPILRGVSVQPGVGERDQELNLLRSQLANCHKEIFSLRESLLSQAPHSSGEGGR